MEQSLKGNPMTKSRSEEYREKLRDPRWQRRRLEIMRRDDFACQRCRDRATTLNVHHRQYFYGKEPWETPDWALVTLCEDCHLAETETRRESDSLLLETLHHAGLFTDDVHALACAFHYCRLIYPRVAIPALCWSLEDAAAQSELVRRYAKWRKERRAAAENRFAAQAAAQPTEG